MKITRLETLFVKPRWVFLKIHTDDGLAASIQLDACTPNFLCQEQASLGEGYLAKPFAVENGYVKVPEGPGLGIEVDEDAVREHLYDGSWETPRLYHEDGSLADW